MSEVVLPRKICNLLFELTDEGDLDSALFSTITDAIEHRIERCDEEIERFEAKHGMKFKDFEKKWENGEIKNKYSREVEKDYWEWEAAVSRRVHLKI